MSDTEAGPDEGVPEERFEFNEGPKHDLSEMEIPSQDREQSQPLLRLKSGDQYEKLIVVLDFLRLNRFFRLLRLGGASKAALECAKHWRCPTCLGASLSKRLVKTTTRLRPFLSTRMVCLELK